MKWLHDDIASPILLYSEIDDARMEKRKVELYLVRFPGYAFDDIELGGSILGEVPFPEIEEIAKDPQFIPEEITKGEFETLWHCVTAGKIVYSSDFS